MDKKTNATAKKDQDTYTVDEVAEIQVRNEMRPEIEYQTEPLTSSEKVVVGGLALIATSIIGALVWFGIKEDQKIAAETKERETERRRKREEREAWFLEQRNDGKIVVETVDGEYLAIPAEQFAKVSVRKKGL